MSDVVIVVAITNPEAKTKAHGISLFLVEAGMPGFTKGKKLEKIGLKAQVGNFGRPLSTFIKININDDSNRQISFSPVFRSLEVTYCDLLLSVVVRRSSCVNNLHI